MVLQDFFLAARVCSNWRDIGRALASGQSPTRVVLKDGTIITAPENNITLSIIRELLLEKVYTPRSLPVGPEDVVVDIGANIGVFSLYAARLTAERVYAFEPEPRNYRFLVKNVEANNIRNIISRRSAICGRAGRTNLHLSYLCEGHSISRKGPEGYHGSIEVTAHTLPQIMDDLELDHIDFLKIDCEGCEGSILKSLLEEHFKRVRKIALEFHDNLSTLDHRKIEMMLKKEGFRTEVKLHGNSTFGYIYAMNKA